MGLRGGRFLIKRNSLGQNYWFPMVACKNHKQTSPSQPHIPSRFLQLKHTVTLSLPSAFLTLTKIAKYDDLRSTFDLNKQGGKGLKKAIA